MTSLPNLRCETVWNTMMMWSFVGRGDWGLVDVVGNQLWNRWFKKTKTAYLYIYTNPLNYLIVARRWALVVWVFGTGMYNVVHGLYQWLYPLAPTIKGCWQGAFWTTLSVLKFKIYNLFLPIEMYFITLHIDSIHSAGDPIEATTTTFSLAINHKVVETLHNRMSALSAWFAAFYVFNFQYPEEMCSTLEFIQR